MASIMICEEAGVSFSEHEDRDLAVTKYASKRTPIVAATPELLEALREIRSNHG
jgi:hypothetical protein